ncbi:retrovirus-related Pol polyprotein from transposon opus [Trichonephila inaurata madagascariensis]|uniref:RNA-directed DNA polymerase n=1 Tax=Trichonephila inaurata madagascariensis TaxID=2747483 RepID=A0A8X6Y1X9_9ARAC|nr:retrovirus-related Pol polyprotein from transposon opus [Trichonephila inaurata madagascariensis]
MLDPETLSHVTDIILFPPAENEYVTLSDRLIREFADSEHQKIKILLTELQLGDEKPSHLLRKMKELSGYLVNKDGILPLPEKVELIANYKQPTTVRDLRKFLGILNFYRKFLPKAAHMQAPLHELLKNSKKNYKREVEWNAEAINAFNQCKNQLANVTLLAHPSQDADLALMTDASDFGLGASLNEITSHGFKPLGDFFQDTGTNNVSELVQQLKQIMHNLKPVPTSSHGRKTVFVHPELSQCTPVFLRHDAIRKPLQPPYDGPFTVVKRSENSSLCSDKAKKFVFPSIELNQHSCFLTQ